MLYSEELTGEDLSRYLNKNESVEKFRARISTTN